MLTSLLFVIALLDFVYLQISAGLVWSGASPRRLLWIVTGNVFVVGAGLSVICSCCARYGVTPTVSGAF